MASLQSYYQSFPEYLLGDTIMMHIFCRLLMSNRLLKMSSAALVSSLLAFISHQ